MNIPAHHQHPYPHDGISRSRRQLETLLPDYVQIDGRTTEDLLLYARKYARLLQFYDENGTVNGNWEALISGDVSVVAAILLKEEKASHYQGEFFRHLEEFRNLDAPELQEQSVQAILMLLLEMAQKLISWQQTVVPGLALATTLDRLISEVAQDGFFRLIAYLRRATQLGIMEDELPLDEFDATWPYQPTPKGFVPLRQGLPSTEKEVFEEEVLLRQLFNKFYQTIQPVISRASDYLEETLESHPEHEPHMALFLSFLLLMERVREDMNGLTKKHLDFYYREVLQIDNQPAVMDQAHVVLELAQGFENGLLESTDRFQDGKDESGKDVLFAPNEELVVTPATLHDEHGLKTLFFNKDGEGSDAVITNVFGSPDADSEDRQRSDGKFIPLGNEEDPAARFGFAIASPMFLLGEGERVITITFTLQNIGQLESTYGFEAVVAELRENIDIYASGEEGWINISEVKVELRKDNLSLDPDPETQPYLLTYTLTVGKDSEGIAPYHEGLIGQSEFGEELTATAPIILFLLDNYGLSVKGDLDLSLSTNVADLSFKSNKRYLEGASILTVWSHSRSMVISENSYRAYLSKAGSIGVAPESQLSVWEAYQLSSIPDTPLIEIENGKLKSEWKEGVIGVHEGAYFRSNARYLQNQEITSPVNPSKNESNRPSFLWQIRENVFQGIFQEKLTYEPNDVIEIESEGTIVRYVAGGIIKALAPTVQDEYWESVRIEEFNSNGPFVGISESRNFFGFKDENEEITVFQLNCLETDQRPEFEAPQQPIWTPTTKVSFYQEGNIINGNDLVEFNEQLIRLIQPTREEERKTDAFPLTASNKIWIKIGEFNSNTRYAPSDSDLSKTVCKIGSDVYQPGSETSIERAIIGNLDNEFLISPDTLIDSEPVKVLMLVDKHEGGKLYQKGEVVYTGNRNNQEYFGAKTITDSNPRDNNSEWEQISESPINPQGTDNLSISPFDLFEAQGKTFYATTKLTIQQNKVRDLKDRNLWELKENIEVYTTTKENRKGTIVLDQHGGSPFIAAFLNQNIEPSTQNFNLWEKVQENPLPYKNEREYKIGDITRTNSGDYFQTSVKTSGKAPSETNPETIWNTTQSIAEQIDFRTPYGIDSVVLYEDNYYVSRKEVDILFPGSNPGVNTNIWNQDLSIEYEAGRSYQAGEIVFDLANFYITQGEVANVHPAIQLDAWEYFDPTAAPKYNNGQIYYPGDWIRSDEDERILFRCRATNQFINPNLEEDLRTPVWEDSQVVINPAKADSLVNPGDYLFQVETGKVFRVLLASRTDSEGNLPLTATQPIATIRSHNPFIEWYVNMHVRDQLGNVFRATKNVPVGIPLSDPGHWQLVSDSYVYKYLVEPTMLQLDLEVEVTGMRSLLLENDLGVINPAKPFMPFGAQPNIGAKFYIGSYEVFSKSIKTVKIDFDWENLPADFADHYRNYPPKNLSIVENNASAIPLNPTLGYLLKLPPQHISTIIYPFKDPVFSNFLGNQPAGSSVSNQSFTGAAYLLDNFDWLGQNFLLDTTDDNKSLFFLFNEEKNNLVKNRTLAFRTDSWLRNPELPLFTSASPVPESGFMVLQLHQHFFHLEYPTYLAQAAASDGALGIPNPPYTPLINSLTLSYTAKETIVFQDRTKGDLEGLPEQFFHIHPYGWTEFVPVEESLDDGQGPIATNRLVPTYLSQVTDTDGQGAFLDIGGELVPTMTESAGNLFLGIEDLRPPQILTILVQVAEGSENPTVDPRFVTWSYLRDNRWIQFEPSQILSDDTNGLLRPGIVKLNVPSDITSQNTMLPGGIFWIRASVDEHPDGVGQVYDIRLHAVKATFEDNENDLSRLSQPLEANQLSKLFFRKAVINKVEQPFASFGGALEEQDEDYYQRVSERLRHRQRAVSIFDYERLVLAQFPEVYQVKCCTHSEMAESESPDSLLHQLKNGIEHRPGMVQVVVLPDLRNKNAIDPLRPRVSNNLRKTIQSFLDGFCSGFATVRVENPVFEEVVVHANVTLRAGKDPGFYLNQLNEDLIRYLSPWRYETDVDLHFGGELHVSPLIDYLDELDYIDYVEQVSLSLRLTDSDGKELSLGSNLEEVCAHTSASVLVSAPQHSIKLNETSSAC